MQFIFENDVDDVVLVRPSTMNPSLRCMGRDLIMRSPTGRGKNATIALVIDRYYGLLDRLPKIRSTTCWVRLLRTVAFIATMWMMLYWSALPRLTVLSSTWAVIL